MQPWSSFKKNGSVCTIYISLQNEFQAFKNNISIDHQHRLLKIMRRKKFYCVQAFDW